MNGEIIEADLDAGYALATPCGHAWKLKKGFTVGAHDPCPVCIEVKAARVEGMEEMRQELVHVNFNENWRAIQDTFDGIRDKLIEATR